MRRSIAYLAAALLIAAPLAACGKKASPESDPPQAIRTMPAPNPPPAKPPEQPPAAQQQQKPAQ